MVSEDAVIAQRDVFLLPLLVEGFATPLQKDSLEEIRRGSQRLLPSQQRGGGHEPASTLNDINRRLVLPAQICGTL